PLLRAIDDHYGFYYAARGTGDNFPGCDLYQSRDNGASYDILGNSRIFAEGVVGRATTVLASWPDEENEIIDESSACTIELADDEATLENITEAQAFAGQQCLWFSSGELATPLVATLTAPRTYLCSRWLRGRLGTEDRMAAHNVGERI